MRDGASGNGVPIHGRAASLGHNGGVMAQHAMMMIDKARRVEASLRPLPPAHGGGQRGAVVAKPPLRGAVLGQEPAERRDVYAWLR